jgi:hypothetical protein
LAQYGQRGLFVRNLRQKGVGTSEIRLHVYKGAFYNTALSLAAEETRGPAIRHGLFGHDRDSVAAHSPEKESAHLTGNALFAMMAPGK